MRTEVIKASELRQRVLLPVFEAAFPERMPEYRAALRAYKRRLGKREEKTFNVGGPFSKRTQRGFQVEHLGQTVTVLRPDEPTPSAFTWHGYTREYGGMKAARGGLLAASEINREMRPARVEQYTETMRRGEWVDLLSDPITITDDGKSVANGQHRLAAACDVDWSQVSNDPLFMVIWGVSAHEAQFADGSHRTPRDRQTIAEKMLRAYS
jgi:hypothetical protein